MNKQRGFTSYELFIAAFLILGVGGWIANIVKLIGMFDGEITAMLIARIIGVFAAPFGAILGFF